MITPENVISIIGILLASDWVGRIAMHIIERREKKKEFNPVECVKMIDLMKDGVCALLRNEIVVAHRTYSNIGYCPIADKQNIQAIYTSYHALGGNDIATKLKEDILELPESPLSPHRKEN